LCVSFSSSSSAAAAAAAARGPPIGGTPREHKQLALTSDLNGEFSRQLPQTFYGGKGVGEGVEGVKGRKEGEKYRKEDEISRV